MLAVEEEGSLRIADCTSEGIYVYSLVLYSSESSLSSRSTEGHRRGYQ